MKRLENLWEKYFSQFVLVAFWLLGLCNNFAYVIMLSAAHDILSTDDDNKTNTTSNQTSGNHTNKFDCNDLSTGTILLADIVPGICIKLIAPLFVHRFKYSSRVVIVIIANALSFLLVALPPKELKPVVFLGVMLASFGSSFGEITFLSLSTLYITSLSLTGWGSGTGAAGLIGSFGYAGLTSIGLSPRVTILIMLFIPVLMAFSYLILPSVDFSRYYQDLDQNGSSSPSNSRTASLNKDSASSSSESLDADIKPIPSLPPNGTINLIKFKLLATFRILSSLFKYMLPLFLVYFAEYFINQGLFELTYFKNAFYENDSKKDHKTQYRWYNVVYQLAVFISRTSIKFFHIKYLSIFPIFQLLNVGIFLSNLFFGYIPSIWIVFGIILWEGLLGGGCYVNAFYKLTNEIPKESREFSIAVTSIADSLGITLAGFTAIPAHNAICKYGNQ